MLLSFVHPSSLQVQNAATTKCMILTCLLLDPSIPMFLLQGVLLHVSVLFSDTSAAAGFISSFLVGPLCFHTAAASLPELSRSDGSGGTAQSLTEKLLLLAVGSNGSYVLLSPAVLLL